MKRMPFFLFICLLVTGCLFFSSPPMPSERFTSISPLDPSEQGIYIEFPRGQLTMTYPNLTLLPQESTQFFVDVARAERFTVQIQADDDSQIANKLFGPTGEPWTHGHSRTLDWQTTRTMTGHVRMLLVNEGDDLVTYDLRISGTPHSANQIKLDDLLAKFANVGVPVTQVPSTQRPTEFDKLYRREVATREILTLVEPQQRIDVYIFADRTAALEAASFIKPGSNRLTRTENGNTSVVELYADSGSVPQWWLDGPFLLYGASPGPIVAEQLTAVLGDPLGKLAASAANVRLRNEESQATWQDVSLRWDNKSIEIGPLVAGVGGYHEVPIERPLTVSILHDGEEHSAQIAPLTAGSYMVDLILNSGKLMARPFRDGDFYAPADLIDVTWTWRRVEYADGRTFTPYTSATFAPTIRFGTGTSTNFGEAGQQFGGNLGCNGMGGLYFANEYGDLLITNGISNMMLCGDDEMESEHTGSALLRSATRYERIGNELHLSTMAGNLMILANKREISAASQIYIDIINGWSGTDTPFLVLAETKSRPDGISEEAAIAAIQELFPNRGEPLMTIGAESVHEFFLQQRSDALEIELPNGEVQLISEAELETLFADGDKVGWQTIGERYPGVKVLFAFSDVVFMDDKGLVYYEVWTDGSIQSYYALIFNHEGSWHRGMTNLVSN